MIPPPPGSWTSRETDTPTGSGTATSSAMPMPCIGVSLPSAAESSACERVNITLMGQTLLSPNPEPMWPGWEGSQARPAVERRAAMMREGRWRELYREIHKPGE